MGLLCLTCPKGFQGRTPPQVPFGYSNVYALFACLLSAWLLYEVCVIESRTFNLFNVNLISHTVYGYTIATQYQIIVILLHEI